METRKTMPLYIGRAPHAYTPATLAPEVLAIRHRLVRDAMRSFWRRVCDWLNQDVF